MLKSELNLIWRRWGGVLKRGILLLAFLLILSGLPDEAEAAEFRSGPNVSLPAGETLDDDLYASGGTISVDGTLNGDLVAAGGTLNVRGSVNGDTMVAGGTLNIEGPIMQDVRAAGGTINLSSSIGGDVIATGGSVDVRQSAVVSRDLVSAGGTLHLRGRVERDVTIAAGEAIISGIVLGNVEATVERLVLEPGARIEGNLEYTSPRQATIAEGASVVGQVEYEPSRTSIFGRQVQESPGVHIVQAILGQLRWFIGTVIVGLLLLWLFPQTMANLSQTLLRFPWQSLGLGLGVLIVAPLVILIVAIIAIIIGGFAAVPVGLVPGAAYLVLLSLTAPVIAILIGGYLLGRMGSSAQRIVINWKGLVLGALILALIGLIPFLDVIIGVLVILFGFGVWIMLLSRSYSAARRAQTI